MNSREMTSPKQNEVVKDFLNKYTIIGIVKKKLNCLKQNLSTNRKNSPRKMSNNFLRKSVPKTIGKQSKHRRTLVFITNIYFFGLKSNFKYRIKSKTFCCYGLAWFKNSGM